MSAAHLFPAESESRPTINIFKPSPMSHWADSAPANTAFSSSNPRIMNPGPTPISPIELLQQLREAEQEDVARVTEEERNYFHSTGTLAEFYFRILDPWRRRVCARGQVAAGTLTNERQSVRCFEAFDRANRPDKWPADLAWQGRPMGFIGASYIREWISYRLQHGSDRGALSPGSMPKRWNHLRYVLNQAFRLKIIGEQIAVSVKDVIQEHHDRKGLDPLDELDLIPTSFTDQQLHAVYQELEGDLELQTAWVLGAQSGPRTADLFTLRWARNIRLDATPPELLFIAEKTKRRIWVPLGPTAVDHLRRLIKQQAHLAEPQGFVFPRHTDPKRKDPEDGERSRARMRRIKRALIDAGIPETPDTERPIQMLRATANSRLNGIETKAGDRATHGKESTVQGESYTDYRDMLIRAVMTLDQQWQAAGIFARR